MMDGMSLTCWLGRTRIMMDILIDILYITGSLAFLTATVLNLLVRLGYI